MATPVLRLHGVARDFSDGRVVRRVLKETTLDILPGEMTVLAGPSGSGKTTLFRSANLPLWLPPAHALFTFVLCFLGSVLALRRALKIEPASAFR
jgi:ABC-type phosphate/phosphonate transport system ATPase subunit